MDNVEMVLTSREHAGGHN